MWILNVNKYPFHDTQFSQRYDSIYSEERAMQSFKLFSLIATFLSTAWMTGCVSTTVPGSVAAERKQLMFYPDSWTQKIG